MPRNDTEENRAYDKRTPGLFKEEWSGEGIFSFFFRILINFYFVTYYNFLHTDPYEHMGKILRFIFAPFHIVGLQLIA